jgi:hypothetical protein
MILLCSLSDPMENMEYIYIYIQKFQFDQINVEFQYKKKI